jgi:formylglycine-generating enzyme required for sulfatase activity
VINLGAFYIDKFEVTNEMYDACVYAVECRKPMRTNSVTNNTYFENPVFANYPVIYVNWKMAKAYCEWRGARLPTEAEWEKAARGEYGNEWSWGNYYDPKKCNSYEDGKDGTLPVGAYSPQGDSPYGAADMLGHVWEWCHSLYRLYPYQVDDGRESEADSGTRVLRGGSFSDDQRLARCGARHHTHVDYRLNSIGFRIVIAPSLL